MASVEFRAVEKSYDGAAPAIQSLSMRVEHGEFMVLLGPSGCGKSTLLRMLAGLEEVSGGEILIGDEVVNDRSPQQRNVAMVFQNYALYPHMSVRANLEFPLRMRRMRRAEIGRRVEETAALLGIGELLARKPAELSGGQRQRVAMGRALVREPSVFLMDEPLSNLDARLRVQIRGEIAALQRRTGTTTLYVTHDQVEAMTLGQRIAVLRAGVLQQVGPAAELYARPDNIFVASFLGSPGMNLFRALLGSVGDEHVLKFDSQVLTLPGVPRIRELLEAPGAATVYAGLRPEAFDWPDRRPDLPTLEVRAANVEALGREQIVYFTAPVATVDGARGPEGTLLKSGEGLMAARLDGSRKIGAGQFMQLAVDTAKLHWFDIHGRALREADAHGSA